MNYNYSFSRQLWVLPMLLSVLLLIGCGTTRHSQKAVYQPLDNALLWKVSGNGLDNPSYVFGTVHLIGKEDFFYPKGMLSAFGDCSSVYFEIDLNEMNDIGSQLGLLTKAFMKDGLTIKDLVSPEEYTVIKAHFDKIGLPFFLFERMKPLFLTVMASMDGDISKMQEEMTSYEMELMQLAQESNKTVKGLETMEFQLSLFDSIPYKEQAQMLIDGINSLGSDEETLEQLAELYKSQNIEALRQSIESDQGIAKYESLLVTKRNKNWIPTMKEKMMEEPTFFAVGAGHLAGPEGVLFLLMKEGYKLSPIKK